MNNGQGLIIIPAYNEEENIKDAIKDIKKNYADFPILVINDGSEDQTEKILKNDNVAYISHPVNLGYGASLQSGYKFALKKDFNFVIQFDGDGQHRADQIAKLIQAYRDDKADIVIGSRFSKEFGLNVSLEKRVVLGLLHFLIKSISRIEIRDLTSGFQLIDRKAFSFFADLDEFPMDYPDANLILLSLKKGFRLREVPVTMDTRQRGKGMFSKWRKFLYLVEILINILVINLRRY